MWNGEWIHKSSNNKMLVKWQPAAVEVCNRIIYTFWKERYEAVTFSYAANKEHVNKIFLSVDADTYHEYQGWDSLNIWRGRVHWMRSKVT